jgi:DNA invertase Pin-like site-specific DNA recombinase
MLVGYARVSTNEQETRMQLDALRAAGVRCIYAEKTSGVGPRPELHRALAALQPGYTLVVYKLDRLARSLKDLLQLLDRLKLAGCAVKSLTEPIDTSSAMGEFVLQILGAVAQLERAIIRERCEAGRVAARARGVLFGRQPLVTGHVADLAARLYREGFTLGEVAVLLGVSPTAVRSSMMRAGVVRRGWGGPRYRRLD